MLRTSQLKMPTLTKKLGLMPHYRNATSFLDQETAYCAMDSGRIIVRFTFREPIVELPRVVDPDSDAFDSSGILKDPSEFISIRGYFQKTTELSFDGTHFFNGIPENGKYPPTLLVYHRDHAIKNAIKQEMSEETTQKRWRHNYWHEAGFDVPTNEYDYVEPQISSLVLHLASLPHAKSDYELTTLAGESSEKVAISTDNGRHVFYLDPNLHRAVRRHEEYDQQNRLLSITTANDFRSIPNTKNLHLPFQINVQYFQWRRFPASPSKTALFESQYSLLSFEKASSTADEFVLNYKNQSGALVGDDRIATADQRETGLVNYTVPANPQDLDAAIQHAIDGTPFMPRELAMRSSRRRILLLVANGLIIVILGVIWYVRKSKQRT